MAYHHALTHTHTPCVSQPRRSCVDGTSAIVVYSIDYFAYVVMWSHESNVRGCDGDFEFVDSGSCECSRLQGVVGDEWNGAPFDRIRRCPHPFMTDKVQRFATRCTMCHLGSLKIPIAICGISGGNIFPMVCRINFQRRSHLLHTGTYRDPR